jgi:hypothetical protein
MFGQKRGPGVSPALLKSGLATACGLFLRDEDVLLLFRRFDTNGAAACLRTPRGGGMGSARRVLYATLPRSCSGGAAGLFSARRRPPCLPVVCRTPARTCARRWCVSPSRQLCVCAVCVCVCYVCAVCACVSCVCACDNCLRVGACGV